MKIVVAILIGLTVSVVSAVYWIPVSILTVLIRWPRNTDEEIEKFADNIVSFSVKIVGLETN